MPRLFTGIEIPSGIATRLALLREELPGARWIDPEDYHLTLRFFGDIDNRTADELVENLALIQVPAFMLQLQGVGIFGGDQPRNLWVGIKPDPALTDLQRRHERAARHSGLPPEGRKYTPHVTIARLGTVRPGALARFIEAFGGFVSQPFPVKRFVLFSSRGGGGGPYVAEDVFPIGDSAYEDWSAAQD